MSDAPRLVYRPRSDATPEVERSALASVYRYLLDCRARKEDANSEEEIAQKERRLHDLTDVATNGLSTRKARQ